MTSLRLQGREIIATSNEIYKETVVHLVAIYNSTIISLPINYKV